MVIISDERFKSGDYHIDVVHNINTSDSVPEPYYDRKHVYALPKWGVTEKVIPPTEDNRIKNNPKIKLMYHLMEPYRCPKCHDGCLYFITDDEKFINYRNAFLHSDNAEEFYKLIIRFKVYEFMCLNCNNTYLIDWKSPWPLPVDAYTLYKAMGIIK